MAQDERPWWKERLVKALEKVIDEHLAKVIFWALTLLATGGSGLLLAALRTAIEHRATLIVLSAAFVLGGLIGLTAAAFRAHMSEHVRTLSRVAELEEFGLQSEYAKRLLYDVIETLQQLVAADEVYEWDDLARAILEPVRGFLTRAPLEDVRIAVLLPREDGTFGMRWAAGHRPISVQRFSMDIDGSMAGIAYTTDDFVVSPDVQVDPRWTAHPFGERPYRSLIALPIRAGDDVMGVLNVVSTVPDAFNEAEVSFVKIIGAVFDLLLALDRDRQRHLNPDRTTGP